MPTVSIDLSFATEPLSVAAGPRTDDPPAKSKTKIHARTETNITIKAEGRGFPSINFQDGTELPAGGQQTKADGAQGAGSLPPKVMASADFDSDGIADLVTADSNGTLRIYRGNADSIYPNSPQAKQHRAVGTFLDSPFYPSEKSFSLGATPDFLEAGDFNADGKMDVLALTNGDNRLQFLPGDGHGNFSAPVTVPLSGNATALAVGEIGRRDGQTDVAVAIENGKGAQLLIFESPEGAFKHQPEIFALPSAATDLAIGHLDRDSYGDVAVACGNNLTIVHGRGQAYPLDLMAEMDIKRPAAAMQTRQFAFGISGLAIGKFTASRGDSLAVLATDGSIYTLDPQREAGEPTIKNLTAAELNKTTELRFAPAGAESELRKLATLKTDVPSSEQEAEQSGQLMIDARGSEHDKQELIRRETR